MTLKMCPPSGKAKFFRLGEGFYPLTVQHSMLFEAAMPVGAACLRAPRGFAILIIPLWPHPARNAERRRLRMSITAFSTRAPSFWATAFACAHAVTGCVWSRGTLTNSLKKNPCPLRPPRAPNSGHARIAERSTTAAHGGPSGNTSLCAVPSFAAAPAAPDTPCRSRSIPHGNHFTPSSHT